MLFARKHLWKLCFVHNTKTKKDYCNTMDLLVTNSIKTAQSVYSSNMNVYTALDTASNYKQMLHDTELMNAINSDKKLLRRTAEILLKGNAKVEGIEIKPLNPENISNTAVEESIPEISKAFWITYVLTVMGKITNFLALVLCLRNTRFEAFDEIAKSLALTIFLNFQEINIIAVIPDQYNIKDSNKFDERPRREKTDSVVLDITADVQKLPKCMTDFLTNLANKHHLIKYLFLKSRYNFD